MDPEITLGGDGSGLTTELLWIRRLGIRKKRENKINTQSNVLRELD
jgi:hypothetical protein